MANQASCLSNTIVPPAEEIGQLMYVNIHILYSKQKNTSENQIILTKKSYK